MNVVIILMIMNCEVCNKELRGRQRKFCRRKCQNQSGNKRNQDYECQQLRGLNRKLTFVKQLGGKCEICGYRKNLAALTFHHHDPTQKEMGLDIRRMSNNSMKTLIMEVKKCQLLCHNCHNELHHPDLEMVGLLGFEPRT